MPNGSVTDLDEVPETSNRICSWNILPLSNRMHVHCEYTSKKIRAVCIDRVHWVSCQKDKDIQEFDGYKIVLMERKIRLPH